MKNQKVILKFDSCCERDTYRLRRIEGYVTPDSIIRLIDIADLDANPREAKLGDVTDEIIESLGRKDGLFQFKTKGLLISAGELRPLERQRYELQFKQPDFEGILDGGHNVLAMGMYMLQETLGNDNPELKKIKRWEDLHPVWKEHRADIAEVQGAFDFLVPVEIIYPREGQEGQDAFENAILEIAQARNNNAELTTETKMNKAGFYDSIREYIDPSLLEEIEWKANDGHRIKVRDVIALAWVPLSILKDDLPGLKDFNRVQIYSSKGACSTAFDKLMSSDRVTKKTRGDIRELSNDSVRSAFATLDKLPAVYDLIYARFPEAYNKQSPRFGGMEVVRVYDPSKKGRKYMRQRPKTKFYQQDADYDYPDGFIMPLVVGVRALMEEKNGKISWKVDPVEFVKTHLDEVVASYYSAIQLANYDPQKVGKAQAAYQIAETAFQLAVAKAKL